MKRALLFSTVTVTAAAYAVPALAEPEPTPTPEAPMVVVANPQLPPPAPANEAIPDRPTAPEGPPRYDTIHVNLGFRVGYVPSRAFDTFASNDVLAQSSIDGTYPLLTRGKLVLAAGLGWDFGSRSDDLRGMRASLATHRLYVPIEGRYYVSPGLAVFGKIAPGAVVALSSIQDASAPNELSGTGWAFSTDVSAGASILMGPRQRIDQRQPRFWITPEIGYALTTRASVRTNPGRNSEELLGSDEDTNLRALSLNGFFWRATVGMTF